jgi:hypothetical protein
MKDGPAYTSGKVKVEKLKKNMIIVMISNSCCCTYLKMIGPTVSHNFNLQSAAEPANPEAPHASPPPARLHM